jgi:CDP-diacylglycerol--serine O-phosphatidyltransferase
LARFNTQVGVVDKRYFIGLASPAAAALMMSFVWIMNVLGVSGDAARPVALVVTVAAALLMVSRFRYYSFKTLPLVDRVPFVAVLLALGFFVALAIDPPSVLFGISVLYAASAPLWWVFGKLRRRPVPTPPS